VSKPAPPPLPPRTRQPRPPLGAAPAAPRTPLELQLTQLWEELLGVSAIGTGDDFLALGGDSLAAVELTLRLERRFGTAPSLDRLLPGLTVEKLARLLAPAAAPARAASPLVAIQPAGDRPPLFCVHPSGGSVLCYLDLARRLGPSQPFYGLQGPDPHGGGEPCQRVEEMAAAYLEAVRRAQPAGPYVLGGYSFGGYVALELARLLAVQGGPPPLLLLLDSRAPAGTHGQPEGGLVAELAAVLERHDLDDEPADLAAEKRLWDDLTALAGVYVREPHAAPAGEPANRTGGSPGLSPGEPAQPSQPGPPRRRRRLGAIQRFFRAYRFLPTGEELDYRDVRRYLRLLRANLRTARAYAPAPYPHAAVLLQTGERLTPAETEPRLHAERWAALIQGGLEVRRVPGHHLNLLAPPAVDALAGEIRLCLERFAARPFPPAGAPGRP
jgi:thioesterase domain-containing protein/acyl carrier protein